MQKSQPWGWDMILVSKVWDDDSKLISSSIPCISCFVPCDKRRIGICGVIECFSNSIMQLPFTPAEFPRIRLRQAFLILKALGPNQPQQYLRSETVFSVTAWVYKVATNQHPIDQYALLHVRSHYLLEI